MKAKLSPFFWSGITMVLALTLTFFVASREKVFIEANQIISPDISLGPVIIYFFAVVAVLALVLFIIPLSKLRLVFRALFALMFAWGVFITTGLTLPSWLSYAVAAIAGLAWLFWARVWLHDLLLLVALAGAGSVFGFLFSPLTFMLFMLVISVYDILAVRFGLMVWMADKLSESVTLPAFVFPKSLRNWKLSLDGFSVGELKEQEASQREYTILGGGDIGFPLMLAASVFFANGLAGAVVVGAFGLAGLMGAFLMQMLWFKDKPVPALPPIALFCLIGFLIATLAMS
jgi:presenilin-like A22 family membrane protease